MTERALDAELAKITDQDREYARDLLEDDLPEEPDPHMRVELVAQWFRKVRYEAVMADRKQRAGHGETSPRSEEGWMAKRGDDLLRACDTFGRAANVIDKLPERLPDNTPLRDVLPGIWPTVGDLRKLRDALASTGWHPR